MIKKRGEGDNKKKKGITVSIGIATDEKLDVAIRNASTANRVAKRAGKNQIVFYNTIQKLLATTRKTKIQIIEKLSEKMAIINAGNEDGVFSGLVLEVKHPKIDHDPGFDMTKAIVKVDKIFPKSSVVTIEQSMCEINLHDEVLLRT